MDKSTLQAVKDLVFEMKKEARKERHANVGTTLYMYHRGQEHALSDLWHTIDYLEKGEK